METGQIIGLCMTTILILILDYFIVFSILKDGEVFEDKFWFWICMIPLVVYIVCIIAIFFGFCEWVKKQTFMKEIKEKYNKLK